MLKLIAPFRAMFNLDSSLIAAKQGFFYEFLEKVREDVNNPHGKIRNQIKCQPDIHVNIPTKQYDTDVDSRYVTVQSSGSLYMSPRVISLSFNGPESGNIRSIYAEAAALADSNVARYSNVFIADLQSLRIDLHDNTIAILSLELAVKPIRSNESDTNWNNLDAWTTSLIFYLLQGLYQSHIFPVLAAIKDFSRTQNYNVILELSQYKIFSDLVGEVGTFFPSLEKKFMLMWVNRTLCYNNLDYPLNDWIKPLICTHSVAIKNYDVHINLGNCLVMSPPDIVKAELEPFWDVMYCAQYYYAAMDVVNINLVKYIGITFNRQSSKMLRAINNDMENIINAVTILSVRYNDLSMEMQGIPRKLFNILQNEWDFPTMVSNVQKKLDLCKSNINVLNQEVNNRNQGRTELMLTSLAGISIMSIFIELGSYATQLPAENKKMVGDIPGFMSLGFLLSGNALSWIGVFIAISVIAFTLKHRRS